MESIFVFKNDYSSSIERKFDKGFIHGGGGGSPAPAAGGGGSSGKVDFPEYMKTWHGQALNHGGSDTPSSSITDLINTGLSSNPFSGENAYDPATKISDMEAAVAAFDAAVTAMHYTSDWQTAVSIALASIDDDVLDQTRIDTVVAAHGAVLDDKRDNEVLPRFKAGMLSVNAVMSSSFVIGESIIEAYGQRDLSLFSSGLRVDLEGKRLDYIINGTQAILAHLINKVEFQKAVTHYDIETSRLALVALKEQVSEDISIDHSEATWDLELFAYGCNVLASISGATISPGTTNTQPGASRSVLGGALSGAAAGAMAGSVIPGVGTAVGAVAGAVIGGLGASMG